VKRLSFVVHLFVLAMLQPTYAQVQGQWTNTGAMQTGRELNAQVRIAGGKVLSIGGRTTAVTLSIQQRSLVPRPKSGPSPAAWLRLGNRLPPSC
jgi:hypothetical protein